MRIATTADLHGFLPEVPACDVLVIAGDLTPASNHDLGFQGNWLDGVFRRWLEAAPAQHIVGIAGNHDFVFEQAPEAVPADLPWTYLQDGGTTIDGVSFWGSPWTPWFHDWAFNAPKGDTAETFLGEKYAAVPDDTDVLLIHGPPAGYGDRTSTGHLAGSSAFLRLIDRTQAKLAVYGHIHEARGAWTRGTTQLVNASAVALDYALVDNPIVAYEI
ncbi:MAG: metallophosphoesterase [Solirubrobacteraceae bacterium]|nr:metallophosphoesterase [Solirubrobacteraceae bacterium]